MITPTGELVHWLENTPHDHLKSYAQWPQATRGLRDLEVQVFIFHQRSLLLLQPEGKETTDEWTVPSKAINFDYIKDEVRGPQQLYKVVIRMLRHAIEERTLLNLQFPDLYANCLYMPHLWKLEADSNTNVLHLSIIVTVESTTLGKGSLININYPTKYTSLKWLEPKQAMELNLDGVTVPRMRRMFLQQNMYATKQDELIAAERFSVTNLYLRAAIIKHALQEVHSCSLIPHAIMLVRKDEEASTMFLMDVAEKISDRITGQDQEVVSRIPLAGKTWQTTRYVVVGKFKKPRYSFQLGVCPNMLKGVLGKRGRLNIEWILWNEEVRLVDGAVNVGAA